jgi:hypothetical protein
MTIARSITNSRLLITLCDRPRKHQLSDFFNTHSLSHSSYERGSYERGCQEKRLLPAPRRDTGVVTCIQPRLILGRVIGLATLAHRRFRRRCRFSLCFATTVLIFFIAGLLYLLRFERVDNLGAYRIPPETGLLIPSDFNNISANWINNNCLSRVRSDVDTSLILKAFR